VGRDGSADSLGGAGDEGDFVFEFLGHDEFLSLNLYCLVQI
jgi:hypothetical protein